MSEAAAVFQGAKQCPVCRKEFTVLWPHQWAYKRGWPSHPVYYCSWKCLRANDKEEGEKRMGKPRRISEDQVKEAVRIAIETGDPREYLRDLGFENPTQKWHEIKKKIRETDPGTYKTLPRVCGKKSKPVKAEPTLADAVHGMTEAADTFFGECEKMGLDIEPVTMTGPIKVDDLDISAIRHKNFGEFYRDYDRNCIDWRICGDEMSMSVDGWKAMYKELPRLFQLLGVEL